MSLKNKINFELSYFKGLIRWLVKLINIKSLLAILLPYVEQVYKVYLTRGKVEAIAYNKRNRLFFMKLMFNDFKLDGLDFKLPKILKPFVKVGENNDRNALRASLSVFYLFRYLRLKPEPSYSTIEKAPCYLGNPSELKGVMRLFLMEVCGLNPKYMGKVPRSLRFKKFHMSTKSGPNGPALWSAIQDYLSIPKSLKLSLCRMAGDYYNLLDEHIEAMSWDDNILKFFKVSERRNFRKIAVISDKEGKTREVAIGDYWSQTILRPLHDYQARILKRIAGDCMHDQSKLISTIKADIGHSYHSIDLSAATDRFPIEIQRVMIEQIAGTEYSEDWKNVMVGYPFKTLEREISYGTGNPMGFYSSFTSFSLCHHFFVWLSCKKISYDFHKLPYMLLGDDIVIGNDDVAREYKLLLDNWDIPFSPEKTHTSLVGFEFAKQIRFHGINVSPLSFSSMFNNRNDWRTTVSFLTEELKKKDWNVDSGEMVKTYLRNVAGFSHTRYSKVLPMITLSMSILDYLQGRSTSLGNELIHYVGTYYSSPVLQNPAFAQVFANEVLKQCLQDEKTLRRKKSLGLFSDRSNLKLLRLMGIIGRSSSLVSSYCYQALPFIAYFNSDVISQIIRATRDDLEGSSLSILDRFSIVSLRRVYGVDVRPVNVKDLYLREREVDYKTSWALAESFSKKAVSIEEIKIFNKKYPLKLVPV